MRFTHPAGLPCYFVVKTPNKGAFYLCSLLFFLDLCKFLLTFSNFLAFRSKAHYNITYYYNLYTEQDQEDL